MRRILLPLALVVLMSGFAFARDVNVLIDGSEETVEKILKQINNHGAKHSLSFKNVTEDFEFRIAVAGEGIAGSDWVFGGGADATAAVLTPECKLLFAVSRGGRMTKGGALNAVSKEIVKQLKKYYEGKG